MTQDNDSGEQELQVMVWYRKEDWDTFKSMFSDAHLLPASYEIWLQMAEQKVNEIQAAGDIVAKVTIDTVAFPAWCNRRGQEMNAESRTAFAIEVIQKRQFMNNM